MRTNIYLIFIVVFGCINNIVYCQTSAIDSGFVIIYNTGTFGNFKTISIYPNEFEHIVTDSNLILDSAINSNIQVDYFINSSRKSIPQHIDDCEVFPNPTSGDFNVKFTSHTANFASLSIIDRNGRLIERQNRFINEGINNFMLRINAEPGIYHLLVYNKTLYIRKQFVIN